MTAAAASRVMGLPARFVKMSGAGNDFLVFTGASSQTVPVGPRGAAAIRRLCARGTGVGADGVLFVHRAPHADGRPRVIADYFNADGGQARFCANGTRCAARLAHIALGVPREMTVVTGWGDVEASVGEGSETGQVTLGLPEPVALGRVLTALGMGAGRLSRAAVEVIVGVPHLVVFPVDGIGVDALDVAAYGPPLRHHPEMPEGANVNFVERLGPSALAVRTYERGVEAETLACGSGVVASAVAACMPGRVAPPVKVRTRSGETLTVDFRIEGRAAHGIKLTGDARIVFEGTLDAEEWQRMERRMENGMDRKEATI
jgi:diaminopimelate epimerase